MPATESKKKIGRPSGYSPELAEKICALIAEGKSERQVAQMEGMPSVATMRNWKDAHPEYLALSARAREQAADYFDDKRREANDKLHELALEAAQSGMPIPKGVVEALRAYMQENARSAALRDDSRYGDRKTVKVEPSAGAGEGLKAFYEQWMKDEREPVS